MLGEEITVELERRFNEHDRRHSEKLGRCRKSVEEDVNELVDTLQSIREQIESSSESIKKIEQDVSTLRELGVVYQNYKGFRATLDALFGSATWKFWLLGAAIVYAITHDLEWPKWFR